MNIDFLRFLMEDGGPYKSSGIGTKRAMALEAIGRKQSIPSFKSLRGIPPDTHAERGPSPMANMPNGGSGQREKV